MRMSSKSYYKIYGIYLLTTVIASILSFGIYRLLPRTKVTWGLFILECVVTLLITAICDAFILLGKRGRKILVTAVMKRIHVAPLGKLRNL